MDKAKAAAKAAKEMKADLDKSGVLDSLKGAAGVDTRDDSSSSYQQEQYAAPTRHEIFITHGMVDPATLLTTEDVRRLTGVTALGEPTETDGGDQALGLRWSGKYGKETYSFELLAMYDFEQPGRLRDAAHAEELLQMWEGIADETEDIAGIGDRAYLMGDMLLFRKGGQTMYVMADTPEAYAKRRALEGLAREVAAKLPPA
ncbi:MAG: hypothetical protein QOG64_852 [Acidimicrobiaceae bacterium]|nr:hypothetical protein [Acidimicrobiaceae bacterium]